MPDPTGGNNRILLKSEEKVVMYDLTARKTVDELSIAGGVRYVVWSQNGAYVAFMSKHNVLLAGKNLEYYHSFHENIRVKSGAWDENGVFIYSTLSHVKYCLPNGDNGIIHSLANPLYIVRVHRQILYCMDREHKVHKQRLNCSEYLFKLALHKRNFNDVKLWISNGRLCGNAVIGYLKQKGFPEASGGPSAIVGHHGNHGTSKISPTKQQKTTAKDHSQHRPVKNRVKSNKHQ